MSIVLAVVLTTAVFLPGVSRSQAGPSTATDILPDNTPVRLAGTVPPLVARGRVALVGPTNAATPVHLGFFLRGQDPAGLRQFVDAVSTPGSPLYHQYLSHGAYVARFGPSPAAVATLIGFLQSQGMQIGPIYSGGVVVDATTTTAGAARVFSVRFDDYRAGDGQVFYAAAQDPQLPAAIANLLTTVVGLNDIPIPVPPHPASQPVVGQLGAAAVPAGGYGPADFAAAYDLKPLSTGGYHGEGQTIALVEFDGFQQIAVTDYDTHFGITPGTLTPITVGSGTVVSTDGSGEVEVELDIEVLHAMAPKAAINVYIGGGSDYADVYAKIAADDAAQVVSSSWGDCEPDLGLSQAQGLDTINQQFAAQGQSFFLASGDTGSAGCVRIDGSYALATTDNDGPHVTDVGGTTLAVTGTGASETWSSETAWNHSGGGLSQFWHESDAPWQQGPGVSNPYDNGAPASPRQEPDVSADADPATGYYTYYGAGGTGNIHEHAIGGTSAATPLWASIIALNNQYWHAHAGTNAGFINPALYYLANPARTTPPYAPFHDITAGNNDYPGTSGCTIPAGAPLCYPATVGFDLATGLGTPDGYNLIRDLSPSITAPSVTLTSVNSSTAVITVHDQVSGLTASTATTHAPPAATQVLPAYVIPAGIQTICTNCTVSLSPSSFAAGYMSPVVVTASKTNSALRAVISLTATNTAGNKKIFDPAFVTISLNGHQPALQVVNGLAQTDSVLHVFNGSPGISRLVVTVNRRWLRVLTLAPNQQATQDIALAMQPGNNNTVTFIALGTQPGAASLVLGDS
ncbi:MAG TPA: S53 family peptidase [Chloroflexota bacterium]|nr:S53 family peptidase [Chloroflexota bacterium]